MKYNLKNFPLQDNIDVERWREGFERELREMAKEFHAEEAYGYYAVIKKILGE